MLQLCEEQDGERYKMLHAEMGHVCNILSATSVNNYEVGGHRSASFS